MILIGCPVYKRDWILPTWLAAIEKQTIPLSEIGFIFELGPDDKETHDVLWDWHMNHPEVTVFDGVVRSSEPHTHHDEGHRKWTPNDYQKMVNLRNHLLDRVNALQPEAYFSLDSDLILENPETLERLFNLVHVYDAVSPMSFMWPVGMQYPSVMTWFRDPGGRAHRMLHLYDFGKLFKADIVMAAVMMSPQVYSKVKYRHHNQGEDLGWSYNAYLEGFDLWCASHLYTPHIMHKSMLQPYLEKGDPRSVI